MRHRLPFQWYTKQYGARNLGYNSGGCGSLEQPPVRLGQIVASAAGRDSGTLYVVVHLVDRRYVAVADGRTRTANNPKRKNWRHLRCLNDVAAELAARLERGEKISDADLQKALQPYMSVVGGSEGNG